MSKFLCIYKSIEDREAYDDLINYTVESLFNDPYIISDPLKKFA